MTTTQLAADTGGTSTTFTDRVFRFAPSPNSPFVMSSKIAAEAIAVRRGADENLKSMATVRLLMGSRRQPAASTLLTTGLRLSWPHSARHCPSFRSNPVSFTRAPSTSSWVQLPHRTHHLTKNFTITPELDAALSVDSYVYLYRNTCIYNHIYVCIYILECAQRSYRQSPLCSSRLLSFSPAHKTTREANRLQKLPTESVKLQCSRFVTHFTPKLFAHRVFQTSSLDDLNGQILDSVSAQNRRDGFSVNRQLPVDNGRTLAPECVPPSSTPNEFCGPGSTQHSLFT